MSPARVFGILKFSVVPPGVYCPISPMTSFSPMMRSRPRPISLSPFRTVSPFQEKIPPSVRKKPPRMSATPALGVALLPGVAVALGRVELRVGCLERRRPEWRVLLVGDHPRLVVELDANGVQLVA